MFVHLPLREKSSKIKMFHEFDVLPFVSQISTVSFCPEFCVLMCLTLKYVLTFGTWELGLSNIAYRPLQFIKFFSAHCTLVYGLRLNSNLSYERPKDHFLTFFI